MESNYPPKSPPYHHDPKLQYYTKHMGSKRFCQLVAAVPTHAAWQNCKFMDNQSCSDRSVCQAKYVALVKKKQ